jgi:hypothetical protein
MNKPAPHPIFEGLLSAMQGHMGVSASDYSPEIIELTKEVLAKKAELDALPAYPTAKDPDLAARQHLAWSDAYHALMEANGKLQAARNCAERA